ncbi:MAG: protoporphyrinogen oxidase [Planctomycetota bacterium]
MKTDIAIVGGGLSGLATAVQVHRQRPDCGVRIFEAGERLGGVIHTTQADGFLIDHGADMFATQPPAAVDLCHAIGAGVDLIRPLPNHRGAKIWFGGKLHPIPDGFVLMRATRIAPVLHSGLLSLAGKFGILAERFRAKGSGRDESVGDFVRRRMGDQVLSRIVAALVGGIYTADIDRLSMQATMGGLAKMEQEYGSLAAATAARRRAGQDDVERESGGARYENFRAFPGGMKEFIDRLAGFLPDGSIELNTPVQSIARDGEFWNLRAGGQPEIQARQLVLALPPRPASALLSAIDSALSASIDSIRCSSCAIVVLGVDESQISDTIEMFGFVVPPSEQRSILAASFASRKFAGRAPQGQILIRCFVGGTLDEPILEKADEELVQIVRDELADMIGLSGAAKHTAVVRWPDSMPQYEVGHLDKVAAIQKQLQSHQGLHWISNAAGGVGIAPVIASAERLAKTLVDAADKVTTSPMQTVPFPPQTS